MENRLPRRTLGEDEEDPYDFGQKIFTNPPTKYKDKFYGFLNDPKNKKWLNEFLVALDFPEDYSSNSKDGVPCSHTKKLIGVCERLLRAAGLDLRVVYNDTISVPCGHGWFTDEAVDATVRNGNGDIVMVYLFFKYPFVTEWDEDPRNRVYTPKTIDVGVRLLGLRCSYALVDDGYTCKTLAISPQSNKDLNRFAPKEMVTTDRSFPSPLLGFYHCNWMVKALENYEKHKQMWKSYNQL